MNNTSDSTNDGANMTRSALESSLWADSKPTGGMKLRQGRGKTRAILVGGNRAVAAGLTGFSDGFMVGAWLTLRTATDEQLHAAAMPARDLFAYMATNNMEVK